MDLTKDYNILLFGNKGWIGSKVYKLLIDKNIKVNIAESRADDYHSIESEIKKLNNITHIMSFVGRTHGVYNNEKIMMMMMTMIMLTIKMVLVMIHFQFFQ